MTARRSSWLLPLALLAVCGALATVLHDQLRRVEPVAGANAGSTPTKVEIEPLPPGAVFSMPLRSTYAAIVERPLFSPTRRPETAAGLTPLDPAADVALKLIGTFITSTERFALLKVDDGAQSVRVDQGGEIAGWTVKEIHEFSVILERDGETEELYLQYDDTPPPEPPEEVESEPTNEEAPPPDPSAETGATTQQ